MYDKNIRNINIIVFKSKIVLSLTAPNEPGRYIIIFDQKRRFRACAQLSGGPEGAPDATSEPKFLQRDCARLFQQKRLSAQNRLVKGRFKPFTPKSASIFE